MIAAMDSIRAGVSDAMWQMITNATSMPCHDFFDTVKDGVAQGMTKAIQKRLKRRGEKVMMIDTKLMEAAISLDVNKATEHEIKGVIEELERRAAQYPEGSDARSRLAHAIYTFWDDFLSGSAYYTPAEKRLARFRTEVDSPTARAALRAHVLKAGFREVPFV